MSINEKYLVKISEYAEKHFIKSFSKRYKWAREETLKVIIEMLERIKIFSKIKDKAEKIHICDKWYIVKCKFKIAWSNESPKTSWNRIIAYVNEESKEVLILLIYTKTDIQWGNETARREKLIKENHKTIYSLFNF